MKMICVNNEGKERLLTLDKEYTVYNYSMCEYRLRTDDGNMNIISKFKFKSKRR